MSTTVGARISRIIQALFPPVTKHDCRRVITFANRNDFISFRHHMYTMNKGQVELKEAGPRFEMQPYEVWFLLTILITRLGEVGYCRSRSCRVGMGSSTLYEYLKKETSIVIFLTIF